jgi:membrane protein required for colicin V production
MNYFDLFLGLFILVAAIKGYMKGFVVEIFSLVAFFLGLFIAIEFTAPVALRFFGDSTYFELVAIGIFAAIFVGLIILINLVAKSIKKVLDLTPFGMFDNFLGSILSVAKLGLILSVLIWMFDSIGIELPSNQVKNSIILPYIIPIGPTAFELIGSIIPYFKNIFDTIDEFDQKGKIVLVL